ncbi:MAG: response regulator [Filomicrobium sp.]
MAEPVDAPKGTGAEDLDNVVAQASASVVEPEHLRILVVEDEPADRLLIERTLNKVKGFFTYVAYASDLETARQIMYDVPFDVALLDFMVVGECGAELIPELTERNPKCAPILVTGQLSPATHHHAILMGAVASLPKDKLDPLLLEVTIRHAVLTCLRSQASKSAEDSVRRYRSNFAAAHSELVGAALSDLATGISDLEQAVAGELENHEVNNSARRLRNLADDLRTFFQDCEQLNTGKENDPDESHRCDLQAALRDVARIANSGCRGRDVTLDIAVPETPLFVDVSDSVLRTALVDLIVSALLPAESTVASRLEIHTTDLADEDRVRVDIKIARQDGFDTQASQLLERTKAFLEPAGGNLDLENLQSGHVRISLPKVA